MSKTADQAPLADSPDVLSDRAGTRSAWWLGAAAGVPALAAGLAAAEVVAVVLADGASPVVEVGNRVVDLVPKPARDWAIDTFGTSDKAVLLIGLGIVLLGLSVLAGTWMVRGRQTAAVVLVGLVLVLGALAPLGRGGAGWGSVVATLAGGAVAVALLLWLGRLATAGLTPARPAGLAQPAVLAGSSTEARPERGGLGRATSTAPIAPIAAGASRRRFLTAAGGVGVAAVVLGGGATWLRSQARVAAERLGITLPKPSSPLPEIPPGVSVGVPGVAEFITPNDRFYRIDTALVAPRVSVEDWNLRMHGRVGREVVIDYDRLLERPMIELDATIACVSNEVGGELVGTARWLGCRLDDLLEEAGIDRSADQVVGRSVDGFTVGFPVNVLDGRDAIVAVGMNGEPLPVDHGFPARLIVPGLYGYVSATKWLSELELTRFDEFDAYWIPRGWDREAPIVTTSRIDMPRDGAALESGRPLAVAGVAWAPIRGIETVEVRVDDQPWERAEMGRNHAATTWRQWKVVLELDPGGHRVQVRATDGEGALQSSRNVDPGPNAATGWHTIRVTAV